MNLLKIATKKISQNMKSFFLIFIMSFQLSSCTSVMIDDYKNEKPTLILENYLNGRLKAIGYFQNRSGKIVKRFEVDINAKWENEKGTIEEDFVYSDGSKSRRVWTLIKKGPKQFSGTASDVEGEALGEVSGNAFRWNYYLNLPVDGSTYKVYFDDWMYLMNDQIMMNKSIMSKWGINLGEVHLVFQKL